MPLILTVIFVGAYQGSRQWGDLYALLFFGLLGWFMKRLGWPRPPLILGVVLGGIVERYLVISIQRYEAEWLLRPLVVGILALALWGLVRPLLREVKAAGGVTALFSGFGKPRFDVASLAYPAFLALLGVMLWEAAQWNLNAKVVPLSVAWFTIVIALASWANHSLRPPAETGALAGEGGVTAGAPHFDLRSGLEGVETRDIVRRAVTFLGWLLVFLGGVAMIGMLPTAFVFVILYMRAEGRERWTLTLPVADTLSFLAYLLFDRALALPWPRTVVGGWFPALSELVPSL